MLPTTTITSSKATGSQKTAEQSKSVAPVYFPEMDALRCLAVALTLVAHFFPAVGWDLVPYTWYGVDVFFTISGFLITASLLQARDSDVGNGTNLKKFFVRRALRLFPVYYLFLAFFVLAWKFGNLHMWKPEYGPYFFGYAANFYFYQHTLGAAPGYSHLWSLSIEEQFYLIWPWLMLFIKQQHLLKTMVLFVCIGVISHGFDGALGNVRLLAIGNFHTLGIGALLAYGYHYHSGSNWYGWLVAHRSALTAASLAILLLLLFYFVGTHPWLEPLRQIALMSTTFFFVLMSVHGWGSVFKMFSKNRVAQYLGRISYGIYVYHMPLPLLLNLVWTKTGFSIDNPVLKLTLLLGLTVLLAALSNRFIERPFLKLKKYFA